MAQKQADRIIGVAHRRKQSAQGQARPTVIAVDTGRKKPKAHKIDDELGEFAFVAGLYPTGKHRDLQESDDLALYKPCPWVFRTRPLTEDDPDQIPKHLQTTAVGKNGTKVPGIITGVPSKTDGIKAGDTIVTMTGGSGGMLTWAMAQKARELGEGTRVMIIPTGQFAKCFPDQREDDHLNLVTLFKERPELFRQATEADTDIIRLQFIFREWEQAQQARKAAQQRAHQAAIGTIFAQSTVGFDGISFAHGLNAVAAAHPSVEALATLEGDFYKDLGRLIRRFPIYANVLADVSGVGPRIAAGLLSQIGDFTRFMVEPDNRAIEQHVATIRRIKAELDFDTWLPEAIDAYWRTRATWREHGLPEWMELRIVANYARQNGHQDDATKLKNALAIFKTAHDESRATTHRESKTIERLRNEGHFNNHREEALAAHWAEVDRQQAEDRSFSQDHRRQAQILQTFFMREIRGADSVAAKAGQIVEAYSAIGKAHKKARRAGLSRFMAFCGCFVLRDGTFPRNVNHGGKNAPKWNRRVRQALFQLGDQFNRQTGKRKTVWGQALLDNKAELRAKHNARITVRNDLAVLFRQAERIILSAGPVDMTGLQIQSPEDLKAFINEHLDAPDEDLDVFTSDQRMQLLQIRDQISAAVTAHRSKGRKVSQISIYSDGHIHKMAIWKTVFAFMRWLYGEWYAIESARLSA